MDRSFIKDILCPSFQFTVPCVELNRFKILIPTSIWFYSIDRCFMFPYTEYKKFVQKKSHSIQCFGKPVCLKVNSNIKQQK